MNRGKPGTARSDSLVLFGATGDLAYKMIFPALYAMEKRDVLEVPIVGVASSRWRPARFRTQARGSIRAFGASSERRVLDRLLARLILVSGDYNDPHTFEVLKNALGGARRPAHYLAIPPALLATVIQRLGSAGLAGVPWYLRSGKHLAATAAEVTVQLKPPPQRLFADSVPASGLANYLRFRLSPNSAVALAAPVKRAGKEFVGDQRELYLMDERPGEESPYERLLEDAMAGNGALFTREDAVEAAWAVVDPVLNRHKRAAAYRRGSWAPKEADALIAADGGWTNPKLKDAAAD